jgi:hypothetical protein
VHPTGGSLRVFRQFVWLEVDSGKAAFSRPAHPRVTHTVGCRFTDANMNKILTTIFLAVALFTSSCSSRNAQPLKVTGEPGGNLSSKSREAEEAAIYSLLLNTDPAHYLSESSTLIILNETDLGADQDNKYMLEQETVLQEETIEDLRAVNRQKEAFRPTLMLNKPYEIMSSVEVDKRIDEDPDWLRTHTLTTFSKIGFNQGRDQALVYMEHYCGGECAIGNLYFLVLNKDVWEVKSVLVSWIS